MLNILRNNPEARVYCSSAHLAQANGPRHNFPPDDRGGEQSEAGISARSELPAANQYYDKPDHDQ